MKNNIKKSHPVILVILDGWGFRPDTPDNAIAKAKTPVWDKIWSSQPKSLIKCSGSDVGLPHKQMGNSEVGHMHIGSGRLIDQDLSRINKAIDNGNFSSNQSLRNSFSAVLKDEKVHILGLLSEGGVHSHENHIFELASLAETCGVKSTIIHAFLDGRDTPPQSALDCLKRFEKRLLELPSARIGSLCGRYYAMDRNQNWDRTKRAYELIQLGKAEFSALNSLSALEKAYDRNETDEFILPTSIVPPEGDRNTIAANDTLIFANFRADRARQLTSAFTKLNFTFFDRPCRKKFRNTITLTDYGNKFDVSVAYPALAVPNSLGAVIADAGLRQLRIAETEKYAHVTFFLNGGREEPFVNEDRKLIPSPDVATYDLKPEMSAEELTEELVESLSTKLYDVVICNFANADMVGHTGQFEATVKCIEVLDNCLGNLIAATREYGYDLLITADHGNAETMTNRNHPHTAHTNNLVPLVYVGRKANIAPEGSLIDLAPSLLNLVGLEIPPEMTGKNLITLS